MPAIKITIEGPPNSGKSTLARLLQLTISEAGIPCARYDEHHHLLGMGQQELLQRLASLKAQHLEVDVHTRMTPDPTPQAFSTTVVHGNLDECAKGGNHDWRSDWHTPLVDECTKCGAIRA